MIITELFSCLSARTWNNNSAPLERREYSQIFKITAKRQANTPGQAAICYSHTVVYDLPALVVCNEWKPGLHQEKSTPQDHILGRGRISAFINDNSTVFINTAYINENITKGYIRQIKNIDLFLLMERCRRLLTSSYDMVTISMTLFKQPSIEFLEISSCRDRYQIIATTKTNQASTPLFSLSALRFVNRNSRLWYVWNSRKDSCSMRYFSYNTLRTAVVRLS